MLTLRGKLKNITENIENGLWNNMIPISQVISIYQFISLTFSLRILDRLNSFTCLKFQFKLKINRDRREKHKIERKHLTVD